MVQIMKYGKHMKLSTIVNNNDCKYTNGFLNSSIEKTTLKDIHQVFLIPELETDSWTENMDGGVVKES